MAYKRDYDKEYREYGGTPEQLKRQAARVKARRYMEKNGRVHKGERKGSRSYRSQSRKQLSLQICAWVSKKTNREKQPKRS